MHGYKMKNGRYQEVSNDAGCGPNLVRLPAEDRTIAIEALTGDQRKLRRTVGGLSDSVGYGLENRAIARLPDLLANRYAVAGSGRLARRFVE